jgi:RNA polymerase sigma-70 factor (ECF subfamily)
MMSLQGTTTLTRSRNAYDANIEPGLITTGATAPESDIVARKICGAISREARLPDRRSGRQIAVEDSSDAALLRSVAEGDKAAMHMIFVRHHQPVFRFILRLVQNHDVAQDIASQVFLEVWRFADRFEYRARVSTWLFSIARFKALNAMRRKAHEGLDQIDLAGTADADDTPEVALERKETSGILRACLAELSPAHRQMLDLFYYRDCSVSELSERIGIPQATVKSRLFYARKQLAQVLAGAGLAADSILPGVH